MRKFTIKLILFMMIMCISSTTALAATELTIVTGGQKGNYYKAAANMVDLFKKTDNPFKWSIKPQQGKGSTDLLKFMVKEKLPLAIAQSNVVDREYSAGTESLRVVIALFPEEQEGPNVYAILTTRADVSEDTIYELTKLLMGNKTKLGVMDSNIKKADWSATPVIGVERAKVHKGAVKYYQEAGIEIPSKLILND